MYTLYIYVYRITTCMIVITSMVIMFTSMIAVSIIVNTITTITTTPSPPIQSLDFRGLDSSKLLILRGGNSHVHWIW